MKRSEYEIGQYLFDGKHAFVHDGYVNADGYGVVNNRNLLPDVVFAISAGVSSVKESRASLGID